jgi:hypothetical protein
VWSFLDSFFCSITEIMFSLHCPICACKQPHLKSPTDILNPGDHLHPLKFSISTSFFKSFIFYFHLPLLSHYFTSHKLKKKKKSTSKHSNFFFFFLLFILPQSFLLLFKEKKIPLQYNFFLSF